MNLLREIELFCRAANMTATRFGIEAANDPRLVSDLRKGRELRPITEGNIRSYIRAHSA